MSMLYLVGGSMVYCSSAVSNSPNQFQSFSTAFNTSYTTMTVSNISTGAFLTSMDTTPGITCVLCIQVFN